MNINNDPDFQSAMKDFTNHISNLSKNMKVETRLKAFVKIREIITHHPKAVFSGDKVHLGPLSFGNADSGSLYFNFTYNGKEIDFLTPNETKELLNIWEAREAFFRACENEDLINEILSDES